MATPTPSFTPFYEMPVDDPSLRQDLPIAPEGLPEMKPEDMQYFGELLKDVDETELSVEKAKERKIMKLLLKVKNGTPPQRKAALRQLTDKARDLGAGPLFNQVLPLLMQPTLEDQERHLLVKVRAVCLYGACVDPRLSCYGIAQPMLEDQERHLLVNLCVTHELALKERVNV